MDEALPNPLITVIAGAGYGKTRMVYSCLHQRDILVAWINLSVLDNDKDRFWQSFTTAIHNYHPSGLSAKLQMAGFSETEHQFRQYLDLLKNGIFPGIRYAFVYDDFQVIQNKKVLQFIEQSIYASFPNITSIILSRREPQINIIEFLSKGYLVRITEEDLRFTQDECAEYFRIQGLHLPREELDNVWEATDGWPFAVHLTSLAAKNQQTYIKGGRELQPGYASTSMRQNIFKLIENEIFSRISPILRNFLIRLSLVVHRSQELLEILAGSKKCIKEIQNLPSFVSFDSLSNTYRIHPLLLDYLQRQQETLSDETKREVWVKTAQWCEANDLTDDAILYYEKAGDYSKVVSLGFTLPRTMISERAKIVLAILDRAPRKLYYTLPEARTLHSWLLYLVNRGEEANREIAGVIEKYSTRPPSASNNHILFGAYINQGFQKVFGCNKTGDFTFFQSFKKAFEFFPKTGLLPNHRSLHDLFICRVGTNDKKSMEEYLKAVEEAEPLLAKMFSGCDWILPECCRAELAYFQGRLDEAENAATAALAKSREKKQSEIEYRSLVYLFFISLAKGDAGNCKKALSQIEALANQKKFHTYHLLCEGYQGIIYCLIRLPAMAASWIKDKLGLYGIDSTFKELETVAKIKYHYTERQYAEVLLLLQKEGAGMNSCLFGQILATIYRAISCYHLKKYADSMEAFAEAHRLAEPNKLDLLFIQEGLKMRSLAAWALKDPLCTIDRSWLEYIQKRAAVYAKKIAPVIAAFGGERAHKNSSLLTRREQELLEGLALGITRKELADQNSLSLNTVKTIIKTIYTKLEAQNLMSAVQRARSLGILKDA